MSLADRCVWVAHQASAGCATDPQQPDGYACQLLLRAAELLCWLRSSCVQHCGHKADSVLETRPECQAEAAHEQLQHFRHQQHHCPCHVQHDAPCS